MKRILPAVLVVIAATCTSTPAGPLTREKTPEALRPWIDWVLYGHEEERCPFLQGDADERRCSWPSRLTLDLDGRGGRFSQQWVLDHDARVPLPGDAKTWPQEVRVDGRAATVDAERGSPGVRLPAGRHGIGGVFEWTSLPPVLQVPTETGLVALTIGGRAVPFPGRDEQGRVWLQKTPGGEQAEDRLDLTVSRRLTDDIPAVLTTRMDVQISGKSREVVLGRPLPSGFVPLSLTGPLPARLDPDGGLRVQARPGRFAIELAARHDGPLRSLQLPAAGGAWPAQEVWVFEARPDLRLATVEGPTAVDPQQTTLPDDWKGLPAYLMQPGRTLTLVEKQRGDTDPNPDQLSLTRTLWLDFDGAGYTIHDAIAGTMRRGWRLEMPPPAALGRVAIDGRDQFITHFGPDRPAGVELRQGEVSLDADSRLEGRRSSLPAVGWDHDVAQLSATLYLPPAWRLLGTAGVDEVSDTWISSWTLLDLFLVLIAAMSAGRLLGPRIGVIALVALALSWIEPSSPHWTWLAVLAFEALRRALPAGRLQRLTTFAYGISLVTLLIVTLPFLVMQVRAAIYPALEEPFRSAGALDRGEIAAMEQAAESAVPRRRVGGVAGGVVGGVLGERADELQSSKMKALGFISGNAPAEQEETKQVKSFLYAPDPKAVVQTGPGLPTWTWRTVSLRWSGPVKSTQTLRLILIPPALNRLLTFLRVALVSLLVLGLSGAARSLQQGGLRGLLRLLRRAPAILLLASLAGAAAAPARAAEIPPADLLNELRTRLLAPPDCRPDCASMPRLALEVGPAILRVRLEIDAAAATAVPLPGGAGQWLPGRVLLDGDATPGLLGDGHGLLWLRVGPGTHQVLMEGPLPDRETVQVPLPLKPHRVTARAQGYRVEGVHDDGLPEDSLQLVRLSGRNHGPASTLEPAALPPFVRVERELTLGLKWQVETRVARLTPPGSAVLLQVPLLAGESVTTAEVRVEGGKALVSLGPLATQAGWTSSLAPADRLALRAPDAVAWVEIWRAAVSPIWHVEAQGIPVIHVPDQPGPRVREWRPWPGESVSLAVSRPEGLTGRTLTIDTAALALSPGRRATDATLNVTIRSSRGAQHALSLPENAELQSVAINGAAQPIRQEGRLVTLPIVPGRQEVRLVWRQNSGVRGLFKGPEVRLGTASVNAAVSIAMPADRWTLFLGGPRLGPAVLFWGLLIVSLLASLALGRSRLTPLRGRHWFLLSLGLTQVPVWIPIVIAAWLFGLGWRREKGATASDAGFDLVQLLLAALSLGALAGLFWSITRGLLGLPEMQISGNGSSSGDLRWYLDRTEDAMPRPWVVSLPLYCYRLAMLAWALWLAQALLRWLKWGWGCFTEGGFWRPLRRKRPAAPPVASYPAEGKM
ncbi:MAG TPA: hypothetical protein VEO94_03465 [Candidatus Dormibacteraeota bacterium]|nr:hypothetical protein [Candidatus Dormibacteraeota bacterium]